MGATVALMAQQGLDVVLCDLTNGEPAPHGTPETRAREAASAAEVVRDERPRWLFGAFAADAHPDHVAASAVCEAARFLAKLTKTDMRGEPHYPAKLYRYLAVHLRLLAKPSFIVDVSGQPDRKLAALACYRSQFEVNPTNRGILEAMRTSAAGWGALVGADAGEPFYSAEEIGISDIRHIL